MKTKQGVLAGIITALLVLFISLGLAAIVKSYLTEYAGKRIVLAVSIVFFWCGCFDHILSGDIEIMPNQ